MTAGTGAGTGPGAAGRLLAGGLLAALLLRRAARLTPAADTSAGRPA
ncbi:hypothetical protein [Kitasatospora sp. NPDC050543]